MVMTIKWLLLCWINIFVLIYMNDEWKNFYINGFILSNLQNPAILLKHPFALIWHAIGYRERNSCASKVTTFWHWPMCCPSLTWRPCRTRPRLQTWRGMECADTGHCPQSAPSVWTEYTSQFPSDKQSKETKHHISSGDNQKTNRDAIFFFFLAFWQERYYECHRSKSFIH